MAYTQDENGNYKRTVRCGYCYEIGHNKSSCPHKKQNHKDQIAAYEKQLADDNFTDDWERNYAQRNLDRHKAELNKSANRGKHRKCSYCSDEGHTRRTCSFRKGDMKSWAIKTIDAREKFVDNMVGIGLGVGALGYRKSPYSESELAIVEHINWEAINYRIAPSMVEQWTDILRVRDIEPSDWHPTGRIVGLQMPTAVTRISDEPGKTQSYTRATSHDFEVVSGADVNPPANFLTLEGALEAAKKCDLFAGPRGTIYYGNTYDDE
jgi:hypothetical protein